MTDDEYEAQRCDWRSLFVYDPRTKLVRAIHLPREQVIALVTRRRANYHAWLDEDTPGYRNGRKSGRLKL